MLIGVENISKCCSKIGHCQAFHTRKPEFPSSTSVATKFIMIFHPLFFQNPVNFQCKVDLDIQKKKVENIYIKKLKKEVSYQDSNMDLWFKRAIVANRTLSWKFKISGIELNTSNQSRHSWSPAMPMQKYKSIIPHKNRVKSQI